FRDREAQVGQIRYVLIPRISKIAPSDLRSAFQQMTGERSFSQEVIIVRVPVKLKEQRTQNQRRISHPPSNHHISPLLQSLGDPLGAQVGIGGNEKRLQRLQLLSALHNGEGKIALNVRKDVIAQHGCQF